MDAPQDYKTAGIFMLIAGVLNIIIPALVLLGSMCMVIWAPLTMIVGIIEIVTGIAVMNGKPNGNAKVVAIVGAVAALLVCNWIALVLEILAFVWIGKDEVQAWLAVNS